MKSLTEIALIRSPRRVFTRTEVALWAGGSPDRQFSLLKRAMAAGEIVHIRRGLYCLAEKYSREKLDPRVLAQRIHGPSYLSLETALSHHGWIPEAVYTVTSVSMDRSREFDTPLGRFSFTRVPQEVFYTEVTRLETKEGDGFLLASPLKALADYVYVHKCDWSSVQPVVGSLRVQRSAFSLLESATFDRLMVNYSSRRVIRFLSGLRKELCR